MRIIFLMIPIQTLPEIIILLLLIIISQLPNKKIYIVRIDRAFSGIKGHINNAKSSL